MHRSAADSRPIDSSTENRPSDLSRVVPNRPKLSKSAHSSAHSQTGPKPPLNGRAAVPLVPLAACTARRGGSKAIDEYSRQQKKAIDGPAPQEEVVSCPVQNETFSAEVRLTTSASDGLSCSPSWAATSHSSYNPSFCIASRTALRCSRSPDFLIS